MPWINNQSLFNVISGFHMLSENVNLIRVVDPDMSFSKVAHISSFKNVLELKFFDNDNAPCYKILDKIHDFLISSLDNNQDVLVHCVAGINRSGAIAQYGEALGFQYIVPNNMGMTCNAVLKSALMEKLWGFSNID